MIKVACFDFFNTIAGYETPREQIYLETCTKHGIKIDIRALAAALPVADKYHREQNRISPIDKRSKLSQMNFYMNHATIAFKTAGVKINKIVAWNIVMALKKYTWELKAYKDTIDAFKLLKDKGITIGIISNIDHDMVQLSEEMGVRPYIDFYVTSAEAGCDKPSPGIFELAIKKAGTKPEETIFTGDQYEIDIEGARNMGMKAILIDRNNWFEGIDNCPRIRLLTELINYIE